MSGNYKSVFDIIGPVMVGPSSSHTAGAVAIGQVAHKLFLKRSRRLRSIIMNHLQRRIAGMERILRLSQAFWGCKRMICACLMRSGLLK